MKNKLLAIITAIALASIGCGSDGKSNNDDKSIPVIPYIITGTGTSFYATLDGEPVITDVAKPIQDVIDNIKTHAAGEDCTIQFGDGETELDIGTANVSFDAGGTPSWGEITLLGKITSAITSGYPNEHGTIDVRNGAVINSKADIKNTAVIAIYNHSGTVNISAGTVSSNYYAIYNSEYDSSPNTTLNIRGGIVTGYCAIYNFGKVNISGGNITATNVVVVVISGSELNISGGTITCTGTNSCVINTVSGRATVNISGGTISSAKYGINSTSNTNFVVNISGGTITTADYAIFCTDINYNVINISGGTIKSTGGYVTNGALQLYMSGSPIITGIIGTYSGRLWVGKKKPIYYEILDADFKPGAEVYTLGASYSNGAIAVVGGGPYINNFELYDKSTYKLVVSGEDLVVAPK